LSIGDICTLVNVVIAKFTQANLVSQTKLSRGVATTMAAQMKERLYHDFYLMDMFLSLAM
jgi:hypothetical protein